MSPCSLRKYKILTALYTEPAADAEGLQSHCLLWHRESSRNQIHHTAVPGEKAANWRLAPVTHPLVVDADALMEISCTMGCSRGGEMLMLVCNQHSPTCPKSTATLPSLRCRSLSSKGVRIWRGWNRFGPAKALNWKSPGQMGTLDHWHSQHTQLVRVGC